MGCFSGGDAGASGIERKTAEITKEQFSDYLQRFAPVENQLIAMGDSGSSILTGQEDSLTPELGEATKTSTFTTESSFLGKDKWLRQQAKKEAKIAKLTAKGKTGKAAKVQRKLDKLEGKIAAETIPGQEFSSEGMTLAGALERADATTRNVFESQRGQTLRSAARFGGMTDTQKAEAERMSKLGESKTRMGLRGATRGVVQDRDLAVQQMMTSVGRGQASGALSGLNAASSMAQQRTAGNAAAQSSQAGKNISMVGQGLGMAAMFAFSSAQFKENIESVDPESLVNLLNNVDVRKFNYNDDMGIPGDFYGPIVEDTPEEFTDGYMLNMYNLVGALIATVQQQNQRIEELENKL